MNNIILQPETLYILPISIDKLNKVIKELLHHGDEITYHTHDIGVVKDNNVISTQEAVHWIMDKELVEGEMKYVHIFDFYKHEGKSIEIIPSLRLRFTLDELLKNYCKAPITLKEFMGDRYDYNPRIRNNTKLLLDLFIAKAD